MSFQAFATANGLHIDTLYAADRVQRCPTVDKPRSKNGAFFWDGCRGWVSDWAQGGEIHWFDYGEAKQFTVEERKAWGQRKKVTEQRQAEGWGRAAMQAGLMLQDTELKSHDYLQYKGLSDSLGMVTEDNSLLVPMRHLETNALQGLQVIRWIHDERRYDKKMLPGMRAKGAVMFIGPKQAAELFLCEGLATGLSIELALRLMRLSAAVLVCFSDSNMVHVASMIKRRAFVFADNDASGAGQRAAEKTGFAWCMSETLGNDANDDHVQFGLMHVAQMLMKVRLRPGGAHG